MDWHGEYKFDCDAFIKEEGLIKHLQRLNQKSKQTEIYNSVIRVYKVTEELTHEYEQYFNPPESSVSQSGN